MIITFKLTFNIYHSMAWQGSAGWSPLELPVLPCLSQVSSIHSCLTPSADLALDFESGSPPFQFPVLRSIIC